MERPPIRKAFEKYQREGLLPVSNAVYKYIRKSFFDCFGSTLFKYATSIRYRKQQHLYDAPAHPYKIIHINVDDIEYFNEEIDSNWGLGIIKGGSWDASDNCIPLRATTHYRGLKQHFEEGMEWEHTIYYRERLQNSSHAEARLEYIEKLFEDMKQNGYCSNYEYGHDAPEGGPRQGERRYIHTLEPVVTIGRRGEIYLKEGFHRLAIVKLLGIEEIPVNVLARHEQWQEIRERVHDTPDPDRKSDLRAYISHPDMGDLVHSSSEVIIIE